MRVLGPQVLSTEELVLGLESVVIVRYLLECWRLQTTRAQTSRRVFIRAARRQCISAQANAATWLDKAYPSNSAIHGPPIHTHSDSKALL